MHSYFQLQLAALAFIIAAQAASLFPHPTACCCLKDASTDIAANTSKNSIRLILLSSFTAEIPREDESDFLTIQPADNHAIAKFLTTFYATEVASDNLV
jgi:hypothetical protein